MLSRPASLATTRYPLNVTSLSLDEMVSLTVPLAAISLCVKSVKNYYRLTIEEVAYILYLLCLERWKN